MKITPQTMIDMDIMEFGKVCMGASVAHLKVMSDALKIGSAEVQATYIQLKQDTVNHKTKEYGQEDWEKFCDTVANIGGLFANISMKLQIASYYSYEKMPECFKN